MEIIFLTESKLGYLPPYTAVEIGFAGLHGQPTSEVWTRRVQRVNPDVNWCHGVFECLAVVAACLDHELIMTVKPPK